MKVNYSYYSGGLSGENFEHRKAGINIHANLFTGLTVIRAISQVQKRNKGLVVASMDRRIILRSFFLRFFLRVLTKGELLIVIFEPNASNDDYFMGELREYQSKYGPFGLEPPLGIIIVTARDLLRANAFRRLLKRIRLSRTVVRAHMKLIELGLAKR